MVQSNLRPSKAVININNLKKNYLNIRRKSNDRKVMAVVKADAYGHGLEIVVNALESLGNKKPTYYAVALADEGIELRRLKITQPILVFDTVTRSNVHKYFKYKLIPNVFSYFHIKILEDYRKRLSKKESSLRFPVHIEVETGMNRLGIDHNEAFEFIKNISNHSKFYIDGIYTHFATADEKNSKFAKLQLKRFTSLVKRLDKEHIEYGLAHAANSGAIINYPDSYFDMIRPGISLYGYYPSLKTTESVKLYPVMSIETEVGTIKIINAGESVSYGRKFIAEKRTKVISVPIGYADGINRNLTNRAKAIINGKLCKQIGTITMDRIMFDLGNDNVNIGDRVILLGKQNNQDVTAWDWSKILNTIPYEITCAVSKRVPRIVEE